MKQEPLRVIVEYQVPHTGIVRVGVVSVCDGMLDGWFWNVAEKDIPLRLAQSLKWAERANKYGLPNSHLREGNSVDG